MGIIIGNLRLDISIEFNEDTKEIIAKTITSSYTPASISPLVETRKITQSEARYYILTFGASSFSQLLPSGQLITIEFNGKTYKGKVHSTVKGRIDSLSSWYKAENIKIGDEIKATYFADQRLMKLEKLN